ALDRWRAIEKAIPEGRARATAMTELSSLHAPDSLPTDAHARHSALVGRRAAIDEDLAAERAREGDARGTLTTLAVDEDALGRQVEIQSLGQKLSQRELAGLEHPKRVTELADLERITRDRLSDLRPEWTSSDLREARFHEAARADFDSAIAA